MARFDPAKAFQQIRTESQQDKAAALEAARRKQQEWTNQHRRSTAMNQLMCLFSSTAADGRVDLGKATALMVDYAQTLPIP
jgi:hypothetical protein